MRERITVLPWDNPIFLVCVSGRSFMVIMMTTKYLLFENVSKEQGNPKWTQIFFGEVGTNDRPSELVLKYIDDFEPMMLTFGEKKCSKCGRSKVGPWHFNGMVLCGGTVK